MALSGTALLHPGTLPLLSVAQKWETLTTWTAGRNVGVRGSFGGVSSGCDLLLLLVGGEGWAEGV